MRERHKQIGVLAASLLCSLGGLWYGVQLNDAKIVEHGGDIGMAITLGFLFIRSNLGSRIFDVLRRDAGALADRIEGKAPPAASEPSLKVLEERIDLLARSITIGDKDQHRADLFLAAATILATLISSFSEWLVATLSGML